MDLVWHGDEVDDHDQILALAIRAGERLPDFIKTLLVDAGAQQSNR